MKMRFRISTVAKLASFTKLSAIEFGARKYKICRRPFAMAAAKREAMPATSNRRHCTTVSRVPNMCTYSYGSRNAASGTSGTPPDDGDGNDDCHFRSDMQSVFSRSLSSRYSNKFNLIFFNKFQRLACFARHSAGITGITIRHPPTIDLVLLRCYRGAQQRRRLYIHYVASRAFTTWANNNSQWSARVCIPLRTAHPRR